MRTRLAALAVLLAPVACMNQEPVAPEKSAQDVGRVAAGYELEIRFLGLIAVAQDTDKVWAFLVNANYDKNQEDLDPNLLPPGVLEEAQRPTLAERNAFLDTEYPRHSAWIRYRNANVEGRDVRDFTVQDLAGADVSFNTGLTKLGNVELGQVSNAELIDKARRGEETPSLQELARLDQLDPALTAGFDQRLAARVRIEAGDVKGNPVIECADNRYSYALPPDLSCPDTVAKAIPLAEEVVVKQDLPTREAFTIDFGHGSPIKVKPKDFAQPVIIEIVNQTDAMLLHPVDPCNHSLHYHPRSYRWFYRLLPSAEQESVSGHFFPCKVQSSFGDPYCTLKQFTISRKSR